MFQHRFPARQLDQPNPTRPRVESAQIQKALGPSPSKTNDLLIPVGALKDDFLAFVLTLGFEELAIGDVLSHDCIDGQTALARALGEALVLLIGNRQRHTPLIVRHTCISLDDICGEHRGWFEISELALQGAYVERVSPGP
jgi:hypothetical protein